MTEPYREDQARAASNEWRPLQQEAGANTVNPGRDVISDELLNRAITRARRRLVAFLLLMYIVSFLDRANIGFAKQALQRSLGIPAHDYALGAGLFFLSYAICEVPSNLILHRVGARVWMARIMVSWGLVSMATMFVQGSRSFYLLRLLLGAAEAGFFPGVILYLTYWFPQRVRGQILGLFYCGAPLALIVGGPVSGLLLQVYPRSVLQNWQWMFLVEGSLAVAVGIWSYWYLDDRPSDARWLPAEEKRALEQALAVEEGQRRSHSPASAAAMLRDARILGFGLIYFLIQMSVYGVVFYLPSEVAAILHQAVGLEVGLLSAIPWLCAVTAVFWLPRSADRRKNHRSMAVWILLVSGCASLAFPVLGPWAGMAALSVAASGFIAVQPLFWTFPAAYLAESVAAGGLALINAVGSVGGFLAPNAKVWADERFHSPRAGLYLLAIFTLLTSGLIARVRDRY